jgi:hypothetical protein
MSRSTPGMVLSDLLASLSRSRQLAANAQSWFTTSRALNPRFLASHRDLLVQLAYLNAFLAWERFLEESFILYLWGKKAPRQYSPRRFIVPTTRRYANQLTLEGASAFVDWDNAQKVSERAIRFFVDGAPFAPSLRSRQIQMQNLQSIRNAVVHTSESSQEKFRRIVRDELGSIPAYFNIGRFLSMTKTGTAPPDSYLDFYLSIVSDAALEIVPT